MDKRDFCRGKNAVVVVVSQSKHTATGTDSESDECFVVLERRNDAVYPGSANVATPFSMRPFLAAYIQEKEREN